MPTPGVYIQEINAFPNSVVPVATDVPVFIGYTQIATQNEKSLIGVPTKINSLIEFIQLFGKAYSHTFSLNNKGVNNVFNSSMLVAPAQIFYLFNCIRLFFANGGSNCYIISVGTYSNNLIQISKADFSNNQLWATLETEAEPTLIVMPDMVNNRTDCCEVYKIALQHCKKMQSRFAIFDVIPSATDNDITTTINFFRDNIGNEGLSFGAAYYPWLNTSVIDSSEINFNNLTLTKKELLVYLAIKDDSKLLLTDNQLHEYLLQSSVVYKNIMDEIKNRLNLLPPSAAMAGIYTAVDNARGVWKAPANVSLNAVNSAAVAIDASEQQNMNVDAVTGKSINAIRNFIGQGTLVWGARTLDGNSVDWKYINVRRTMMMIEQSIKYAVKAYVFEPNDNNTWITIKAMIENSLINLWKDGALQGAKPEDAFAVIIGLGKTMTNDDILNNILRIAVLLAVIRPAEFIEITFQQKQLSS